MTAKEKKYKYALRIIKSTQLHRSLENLRALYQEKKEPEYLVVPYVLTCAAYLEAKLNDSFCDAEKQFGQEFSAAMQSLKLPTKLKVLVPLLTNGKYDINMDHFVYQRLISLIRVRNAIAHAKSELEEIKSSDKDLIEVPILNAGFVKTPKKIANTHPDITLDASKTFSPLEYHDALDKLEKWFFLRYPDKLSKVAMVIDRSQLPQWEEGYTCWVKHLDE